MRDGRGRDSNGRESTEELGGEEKSLFLIKGEKNKET